MSEAFYGYILVTLHIQTGKHVIMLSDAGKALFSRPVPLGDFNGEEKTPGPSC